MQDFARKEAAGVPTALSTIARTSDVHEQEADHAAERVMRMPGSPVHRGCHCGGDCPRCSAKGHDQANGPSATEPPGVVHDVVRTPGRPLDAEIRSFMEPRFGKDFSQVRVHTDANSAESAKAVDAQAYTFGRHVVFGPGRYVPATNEGRSLLAHELAHVIQQEKAPALQRKPDGDADAKARRDRQLEDMARDPADAHKAWKRLTPAERDIVTERMGRRFGEEFAKEFLDVVKKGKPQFDVDTYPYGQGPTPKQLTARGYRRGGSEQFGNAGWDIEVWVHPSGKTVRRDLSSWKFPTTGPGTKPGGDAGKSPVKKPPVVDPPIEPPVTTTSRHEEALDHLEDMKDRNTKLHALCEADPFNVADAESAEIEFNFAREAVRDFKDLDWTGVYPDFWADVAELADENLDLRAA
ncbi:MAG: DUF4157 domain-containing protein, partial [Gemmatimonadales bacterium]